MTVTVPLVPALPKPQDYLTSREIQGHYRMSIGYLSQLRSRGEGPRFYKLGARKILYLRADVEAWINAHTSEPHKVG